MPFELSERQQQTVAAAITILAVVVIVSAVGALLFLLGWFVNAFSGVFMPLVVAGILALVLNPYFEWLRDRMPPLVAVAAVFLSILLPVVAFFWFFGALLVEQVTDLFHRLPDTWSRVSDFVAERWPRVVEFLDEHDLTERLEEAARSQAENLLQGVQAMGSKAVSVGAAVFRSLAALFSWAVLPVYFVFFLLAEDKQLGDLEGYFPFLKPETRKDLVFLVRQFLQIVVSFFRGQLVIALLQGLLFATGFSLVGLRYGFVLGLVLGFLNVIPYLGSIVGLGVALPLAFFQEGGGIWKVVAVLVVFAVVQMIEGYVLTPKIMGDRTGLHPMAIIVAIFFWGSALGGIMGMILAIPLTAFMVVFWRLMKEKYIRELV